MAINQRKAGAILSYVHLFLSNTISLLYTPLALRLLGQSQYGLFGTASSVTAYLGLLGFGIGGAYIRWNMKYRAENDVEGERRLNGVFFTIFAILSALTLIVGLGLTIASPWIVKNTFTTQEQMDLQMIILLNVINMTLNLFLTPVMGCIQAYEKFFVYRIITIANAVLTPVLNIILLYMGGKAVALSVATLVLSLINYIFYYMYARKKLNMRFSFKGFKFSEFKEIIVFSSFIFLNSITDLITNSTDNILISALIGASAVAVYSVGRNFSNYFGSFSSGVSSVFAPKVYDIVWKTDDNNLLDELFLKVGRVQFIICSLILLGYISVGDTFISIWAGEDYGDSYWIGLLLLLGAYIPLFQNVGIEIQKAKNKHKFRSVVFFLIALGNIGLTIPFINIFEKYWNSGGVGAAFATFLCLLLGQGVIMNIYYHKAIGLNMFKFWKGILAMVPGMMVPVALCVAIEIFIPLDTVWKFLYAVIVITVTYIVSVWFLSMNAYERDLLRKPVVNLVSKIKRTVIRK